MYVNWENSQLGEGEGGFEGFYYGVIGLHNLR